MPGGKDDNVNHTHKTSENATHGDHHQHQYYQDFQHLDQIAGRNSWTYAGQSLEGDYTYSPSAAAAAAAATTAQGTDQARRDRNGSRRYKRQSPTNKRLRRLPPVQPSPLAAASGDEAAPWSSSAGSAYVSSPTTQSGQSLDHAAPELPKGTEAAYVDHTTAGQLGETEAAHVNGASSSFLQSSASPQNTPSSNVRHVTLDESSTQRVVEELVRALSAAPPASLRASLGSLNTAQGGRDTLASSPSRANLGSTSPMSPGTETSGLIKEISDFQSRQSVSYETRDRFRRTSEQSLHAKVRDAASAVASKTSAQPQMQPTRQTMFGSTSIPSPSTLRARAANVGNFFSGLGSKMRRGSVTPLNMSMTSSFRKYGSALDNIQELNAAKKFSSQRHLAKCDGTDNEATAEEEEEAGVVGRKSSGSLGSNDAIEKRASADSLSELELRKLYPDLWESFRRYDADGDGTVTPDELVNYLEVELDSTIAVEDITKFFEAIDNNGDGYVSFKELADWYHSIVHSLDMGTESQQGGVTVGTIFDVTKFNLGDIAKSIRNVTHANSAPGLNSSDFEDWEEPSRWIVHPFSTFHVSWDLIISAVLVITLVTLPLSLAFENFNDAVSGFNLTVDIFFCLDIAKNFFTGYVDIDGVTHLEHRDIVRHYLLSWFMPDLVSSVPIDLVLDAFGDVEDDGLTRSTKGLKLIRLVRMTKLFRLLRMGRAAKFFAHWHRFIEDRLKIRIHDSTIRMLKLGVLLLVLAHWIGCLQFMMCRLMDFPASSWVVAAELDTMSESTQYSWSFFKALAQMIGIGFETPPITNLGCLDLTDSWCKIEMWITLSSMYLGSVFYAIMISNISSIIFSMNMASRLYQEKTQQLNEYMRSKRLPPHLRDRVRDYFSLRYSEGKIFNEEAIMKDLSPSLRRDIMFFTSRELFLKVPFFRECTGNGFISSLATSLTPMVAFQDDVILEEGSVGDSMFFISSGKILIYVEEYQKSPSDELPSLVQQQEMQQAREHPGKSKRDKASSRASSSATSMMDEEAWLAPKTIALASISSGSFFGEVALILPVRRTASAKAIAVSILYMLDREALLTSLKDFPDIYARLRDIATSRVRRITRKLRARAAGNPFPCSPSSSGRKRNRRTTISLERDLQDVEAVALNKQTTQ